MKNISLLLCVFIFLLSQYPYACGPGDGGGGTLMYGCMGIVELFKVWECCDCSHEAVEKTITTSVPKPPLEGPKYRDGRELLVKKTDMRNLFSMDFNITISAGECISLPLDKQIKRYHRKLLNNKIDVSTLYSEDAMTEIVPDTYTQVGSNYLLIPGLRINNLTRQRLYQFDGKKWQVVAKPWPKNWENRFHFGTYLLEGGRKGTYFLLKPSLYPAPRKWFVPKCKEKTKTK